MKKLLLILILFSYNLTSNAQQSKSEEICNSIAQKIALTKDMKYNSELDLYFKIEDGKTTDAITTGKNGLVNNYQKTYYFLSDEKKKKALSIFIDDTFIKRDDYVDEDSLDAESWHSKTKNIFIIYTPFELYHLKIFVACSNNRVF